MPNSPHPATRPLANPGPDVPLDDALRAEVDKPRSFAQGPAVVTDEDMTALYRRRRLLQRLEGLAEDALLDGCESAAQVLRDAAESLRLAVLRDAWSRHDAQAAACAGAPVCRCLGVAPHNVGGHRQLGTGLAV